MSIRRVWGFVCLFAVLAVFGFAAAADDHGNTGSNFDFTGAIQALPASGLTGDWMVGAKTVHATATTEIRQQDGPAVVGASAEVKGSLRMDGSVDASRIEVKHANNPGNPENNDKDFVGAVTALPGATGLVGDWTVGGKTVHVTASTRLNKEGGVFAVGSSVEVKGTMRANGSIDATEIELKSAAPAGLPPGQAEFRGAVESLPTTGVVGDWTVSGKTVHVSATTRIQAEHGAAAVGSFVEIHGTTRSDGSIDATNIEVKLAAPGGARAEFRGAVESLPAGPGFVGDTVVSGRTIHITATTRIDQGDGALAVGALVEVKGTVRADNSIDATRLEVEFGEDSAASGQANDFHLSSATRKAGLNGSFFTTSLTLSNSGTADATVKIKFLGHDRDGRGGIERAITVPAGATLTINDLLGSFFGIGDDFGGVRITSSVPTLVVDSNTGTPSGPGAFGQQLRATEHNDLITRDRPRSIAGVRSNGAFRTNLMLMNATENPLDVDVKLVGSDGRERGSSRIHLEPLEMHQINDAPRELGGGTETGDDARLVLSTATSKGAFAAAASRIDNVSNDPSALLPR
ncbi:MAG: DUF5666 domain-containing protein [Acidobacteriota bacterium]|nr:DUF5666 domain-containing protein [Acidobacteriota bacterium]